MNELVEFFTDPLRLTLLVAGVIVIGGILIFGRRSNKVEAKLYHSHSSRDFRFNPPPDLLVDEEVIVLPPRRKESEAKNATPEQSVEAKRPDVHEFSAEEEAEGEKVEFEPAANSRVPGGSVKKDEISMQTYEYHQQPEKKVEKPESSPVAQPSAAAAAEIPTVTEQAVKPAPKPVQERFVVFHVIPATRETFTGKEIHQAAASLGLAFGKHNVYHFPADNAREGNSQFCLVNMTAEGMFDKDALPTLETRGISLILRLSEETKDGLALFSNMLAIAQGMSRRLNGEILDQTRVPLTPSIVTNLRSDIAKFQTQLNQRAPITEV